ncbi:MAG TPA: hypothetical protein VK864_16940 [Longimicrobiales bacterium]|nr:hypothetical protein [Longimicrobiales bacterium]
MNRIFLLSPASTGGRRARLLLSDRASFPLAQAVRSPGGAPLGETFAFLSGLYFRGKLAYARAFANPPRGIDGVFVITASRGLLTPETPISLSDLAEFASVPIDLSEERYRLPLQRETALLARSIGDRCEVVLLGSVATDKYVSILTSAFGNRLRFPAEFVGRGDMSRGGLMLRCADDRTELTYIPVAGAERHGARPPKLEKRRT